MNPNKTLKSQWSVKKRKMQQKLFWTDRKTDRRRQEKQSIQLCELMV